MTGRFVLTSDQFDSIAAGHGTPGAITVLRDGQLAKRKILLRGPMATPAAAPAVELLLRAERADPEATADVLRHPHLDAWASSGPEHPGYLAQIAAAAAVRAGLDDFTIEVPATYGWAYLPTVGAVETGDETVTIGASTRWMPLRHVALEPGYRVAIEDLEPFRDCYQWRPLPRLSEDEAVRTSGLLRDAWALVVRRHPHHAEAMRILLRSIVPLARPSTGTSVSAASRHASGSIAIAFPETAEELCQLMIHEFMHMKLDALRDLVELHENGSGGRFLAPWRMDPRPVGPLMQGIYAHAGVAEYYRVRSLDPDAPPVAALEFAYWREQTRLALGSLVESGELTPYGERFAHELGLTLDRWGDQPVPPAAASRASAMVLAQTVRWRLRNWRPEPDTVREVVEAWRKGESPGRTWPPAGLRTDAAGEPSGLPGLVATLRASIVEGGPAIDEGACSAYTHRVTSTPEDDDAWVGLAVAASSGAGGPTLLERRPDLVRTAYAQITDPDGGSAFIRWATGTL